MPGGSKNILVVGAGFAGAVAARQLAEAGHNVLIIEKRSHVGGNAYDCLDDKGVLIQPYGPHIFHTNSSRVFEYLSKFTAWRDYQHHSLSSVNGDLYPFPLNINSINAFYKLDLTALEMDDFLSKLQVPLTGASNFESYLLSHVGPELYDAFFYGYTKKLWQREPRELSASLAARVKIRRNFDDRNFYDKYQGMPLHGYTALFERLLGHPLIQVQLDTCFTPAKDDAGYDHVVYTGPVSHYFDECFGPLAYLSIRFEHEHIENMTEYQAVGSINYANDEYYTRVSEFKHFTGQRHKGTSIVREVPQAVGDPHYPVLDEVNQQRYLRYKTLTHDRPTVSFVGRLAQYQYYNIDQVVAASLSLCDRLLETTLNS